ARRAGGLPRVFRRIAAVLMLTRRIAAAVIGLALSALSLGAQTRRFYPDDAIWHEPLAQHVKHLPRYEPDLVYQTLENLSWGPGDKLLNQRAQNLNTVDE